MRRRLAAAVAMMGTLLAGPVWAQADIKPDDKWRFALGAGYSFASGNSRSNTISFTIDGARASVIDKWTFGGRYLRGSTDDEVTADQTVLTTRYDRDLNPDYFGFVQGDYLRDRPANLSMRLAAGFGVGRHLYKTDDHVFDVFGGVGYTFDQYITATEVADRTRDDYGSANLLIGEESTHKLTDTTSFKQRLVLYPNLGETGEFRATFDSGLAVAINKRFSLTATVAYRYASDPGTGLKTSDTLFVTGLSMKTD